MQAAVLVDQQRADDEAGFRIRRLLSQELLGLLEAADETLIAQCKVIEIPPKGHQPLMGVMFGHRSLEYQRRRWQPDVIDSRPNIGRDFFGMRKHPTDQLAEALP